MPRNSRLSRLLLEKLIEHFIAGTPARSSAFLCGVSRKTATPWYHRFRGIITKQLPAHSPVFQGGIEIDERYFGGRRKGKRGRGASGKTIVFGLYKRDGRVYTVSVCDTRTYTLYNIIKEKVTPDSIVYTDAYHSYDILDVSAFQHYSINHAKEFAKHGNHTCLLQAGQWDRKFLESGETAFKNIQWNTERTLPCLQQAGNYTLKNVNGDLIIVQLTG